MSHFFFPGLGASERWSWTPQGSAKLLISGVHLSCITSNLLLLKRIPFGRKKHTLSGRWRWHFTAQLSEQVRCMCDHVIWSRALCICMLSVKPTFQMMTECITGLRRIGPFAQAQWRPQTDCFVQSRLSWCDPQFPQHLISISWNLQPWSLLIGTYCRYRARLRLTSMDSQGSLTMSPASHETNDEIMSPWVSSFQFDSDMKGFRTGMVSSTLTAWPFSPAGRWASKLAVR